MNILIFEDEIPAYEKILSHVMKHWPKANMLGWGRSTVEMYHFLEKHKDVDLIFSDIKLLDGNSFDVYENVKVSCPIIFCTAYDEFLFQAFKTNGIAYLLKPYNEENFSEAIEKYESLFKEDNQAVQPQVMSQLNKMLQNEQHSYKRRFSIKKKTGIKLLNIENIASFHANGDFSIAYDEKGDKHVVNYSLGDIESRIDPKLFFRINRSEIIHIDFIEKIEPYFKNRLSIQLQSQKEVLHTSSSKTKDFRIWLEA